MNGAVDGEAVSSEQAAQTAGTRLEHRRSVESVGAGAGSSARSWVLLRGGVIHAWSLRIPMQPPWAGPAGPATAPAVPDKCLHGRQRAFMKGASQLGRASERCRCSGWGERRAAGGSQARLCDGLQAAGGGGDGRWKRSPPLGFAESIAAEQAHPVRSVARTGSVSRTNRIGTGRIGTANRRAPRWASARRPHRTPGSRR